MIDWDDTFTTFGYRIERLYQKKPRILRPKVVCLCDICSKRRIVAIRVKSEVVDGQWPWRCPACIGLSRSEIISSQMKEVWCDDDYRNNQINIKEEPEYIELQAEKSRQRWLDDDYRNQLETGIDIENYLARSETQYPEQFAYDLTSFTKWANWIQITCKKCDYHFQRKPLPHLYCGSCPRCGISKGHREIADFISQIAKCNLNDRHTITPLELDIYIPSHNFAVEYHGLYRHSYGSSESKTDKLKHKAKAMICIDKGIRLLQIFDYEWLTKKQLVCSMIEHMFRKSQPFMARKLMVKTISNRDAAPFFMINHLQGHRPAKITLALADNNEIMMAMSFSKYKDSFEIIRMATKMGYHVNGGASKLLYHFRKTHHEPISTFADLRHSVGNVYKQLGFKTINITQPNYFYYKNNYKNILSRQQCQKSKLHDLLGASFNPIESESRNMFRNGYRRVWDAGHIKLVLK